MHKDLAVNIKRPEKDTILHTIALTLIPGIGPVNAKTLISYCGSAEKVFRTKKQKLIGIPGIGEMTASAIVKCDVFERAENEVKFIQSKGIQVLAYWEENYPARLKNCIDAPVLLFYKGNADLNAERVMGIVGTRKATEYGRHITDELVDACQQNNILVISGLAYGIDVAAHKACVKKNVPTVGVVGHGLDMIYPSSHTEIARKMTLHGGVLTEFLSGTQPDRQNFPRRNRIVAGMVDALVVVETAEDGGAVITAAMANSYNRDVMAFPGNINLKYSKGCNYLIKTNRASLVENADDILNIMSWKETEKSKKPVTQRQLFIEFSPEEKLIYDALNGKGEMHVDEIYAVTALTPGILASNLLALEFQGIIAALPGKRYKLS